MTTTAEQRITLSDPVIVVKLPNAQRKKEVVKNVTANAETEQFRWVEDEHPRDHEGRFTDEADVSFDFLDDDAVLDMHHEMTDNEPWTTEQRDALGDYTTSDGYTTVNGMLRGTEEIPAPSRREVQRQVDTINSAMRSTTRNLRTGRWVHPDAFGVDNNSGDLLGDFQKLRGQRFRDDGFTSTSTQADWGETTFESDENYFGATIFTEIDVPAGTPAAYLGERGGPGVAGESELLLASGREFELVDVKPSSDSSDIVVRLRVIS